MAGTLVESIANLAVEASSDDLPLAVADEVKRQLLDTIGCALGAGDEPKGRAGVNYGRILGGTDTTATIIGHSDRSSVFGAAFANGELMNATNFDPVLPPGHVSTYVIPAALATAEQLKSSGPKLISALAVAHELTYRVGKAMDYFRDVENGEVALSKVLGYSATIFGATAAVGHLKAFSTRVMADAIAIAANISLVNSHRSFIAHAPSATIKALLAGALTQSAYTAAYMAELGHRGDLQVLDDADVGYRRFIGSQRWEPDAIRDRLGEDWRFVAEQSYKPYPHCRVLHGLLDVLIDVVTTHDIAVDEIDEIRAWGEGVIQQPLWLATEIERTHDAQYSIAHGLAVGAHRIEPSTAWLDPDLVFSESVLSLMKRVEFAPHPDYARIVAQSPGSRPSRIEVHARGRVFRGDGLVPKGTPSDDPVTRMTTDELVDKFFRNARGVLTDDDAVGVANSILNLESVDDVSAVLGRLARR
ncbi:MmgE/PrpD family protein [Saccharomonospora sp. NPDC046836]|uniref:MmgE/PrpD family protein n=1 Tax=Saccharomonospora sp. NPDC046836 TaxID=3156921 RepID=UPI0033C986A7